MTKTLLLVVLTACLAFNTRAEVLPPEKLLPDDTLFVLTAPDFPKVRNIFATSPIGQFLRDPAMKDFTEKFNGRLMSDYLAPLERDLKIHFADYTNLPQGQMTFAITQNGWPDKEAREPAILFLLDARDKSSQLKTNLTDLKKKWIDAGKTIKTEKIRDVDFSVISLSGADLPKSMKKSDTNAPGLPEPLVSDATKNAPKKQLYIGQAESLLILGDSPKAIEKILVRMSGGAVRTMGELPDYQADSALFHNAPLYGWLNMKAITDAFGHNGDDSAEAANPLGLKPGAVVTGLGLSSLRSVAFNYMVSDAGAQLNLFLASPEADRSGLVKLLTGESKDCTPPPFVPASAVRFQRWRLDGQKTWEGLRKIVGQISPAAGGVIDLGLGSVDAAAKEKNPDFDIKKNLFGNLGDDFITYDKAPKSDNSPEMLSPPSIFLIASPNAEQLANALKSVLVLYSAEASTPTDRDFLGHKIYSITTPGASGAPAHVLSYAWSGGYLAVSMNPGLLEEYLRSAENPGKPLRDTLGLAEATQVVSGPGTSLFGYSNASETERALFDVLKKDPASNPLAGLAPLAIAMGMGDIKVGDWVDVSLLPSFDAVSKYFYFSVYAGSANNDGLTYKFFAPTPPQLKK